LTGEQSDEAAFNSQEAHVRSTPKAVWIEEGRLEKLKRMKDYKLGGLT
jgi:hypothetical protein